MLKANYHTHLKLCGHARGMSEDYCKVAIDNGYEVLGISDHAFINKASMTLEEFNENYCYEQMDEDCFYNVYLNDVKKCRDKYKDKLKVYIGLETEFLDNFYDHYKKLRDNVDYLILGIHFFNYENRVYSTYNMMNEKTLEAYVETAIKGMESGLFKVLAHPDLFMYNYYSQSLNKEFEFDSYCEKCARRIIECAIKNNIYLEINCNGMVLEKRLTGKEFAYPRSEFFRIVSEYKDALVIIGVDAHTPEALESNRIEWAKKFANENNIKLCDYIEDMK